MAPIREKKLKFKEYNCFDEIFIQDITGPSYKILTFFCKLEPCNAKCTVLCKLLFTIRKNILYLVHPENFAFELLSIVLTL